jgi:hypothetical protein
MNGVEKLPKKHFNLPLPSTPISQKSKPFPVQQHFYKVIFSKPGVSFRN